MGVGMLGFDRVDEAIAEFETAATLDVNHLWSRAMNEQNRDNEITSLDFGS